MPAGYWCPVLHAHLPYVRHPEYPSFLEEDWFFEALTETYVPILRVLDGLLNDGVEYRLTMTLSPPLVSMMTDELLVGRYHRHLDNLVELARREVDRTKHVAAAVPRPRLVLPARVLGRPADLPRGLRLEPRERVPQAPGRGQARDHHLRRHPRLLPADGPGAAGGARPGARRGARTTASTSAASPDGIWLPECGYMPGHEVFLKEAGLRFSFLESHGLTDAHPRPSFGVHAPIVSPGGIVFFGRDMESSRQVWSAESGYPGDFDYREFYKDVGWELPMADLEDFLPDGERKNLGIKYYRVTGRGTDLGAQAALRARVGHGEGGEPRRQLPPQPPAAGRAPGRRERARADRREPLRRRALRALVVRGAAVPRLPVPEDALRPGRGEAHHPLGVPRSLRRPRGLPAADVHLGRAGLRRGVAQRVERLDLPAPRRGGGAHGRAGAALRARGRASSGARSTRRRASSCWRSPPTGRSS